MMWPFGRAEKRQQTNVYTDAVVAAIVASASGAAADPSATAALEAAAGALARAFASGTVTPDTPATRAVTPGVLALIGRELIRRGEALHVIEVSPRGRVRLCPAASWDLSGGDDPDTWMYRCDVFGPSSNRTRFLPAARIVHCRYVGDDPNRPYEGVGPLQRARLTSRLHAELESALADEAAGTRGHVLPIPTDGLAETVAELRRDIGSLRGRTILAETTAAAWGEGRQAAPRHDWRPSRIGADPPASLATLRSDAAQAVLGATGTPVELFMGRADGTAAREAWRRYLHGTVSPLAAIVSAELAAKLEVPDLVINFEALYASDLSGRARAFGSMVKSGMPIERAAALSGLMEPDS